MCHEDALCHYYKYVTPHMKSILESFSTKKQKQKIKKTKKKKKKIKKKKKKKLVSIPYEVVSPMSLIVESVALRKIK